MSRNSFDALLLGPVALVPVLVDLLEGAGLLQELRTRVLPEEDVEQGDAVPGSSLTL